MPLNAASLKKAQTGGYSRGSDRFAEQFRMLAE